MERRTFVRYIGTLGTVAALMPDLLACSDGRKTISMQRLGAAYERGHQLRPSESLSEHFPVKELRIQTVIAGGGISGLSAAYHLHNHGYRDFLLFDLNDETGGNSGFGSNAYSRFPLGAHYLSLANPKNKPLISFLKQHQLITGEQDGKPVYNEDFLCHAPDERLLYKGVFQEGLIPEYGADPAVQEEIARFLKWMNELKSACNPEGVDWYHIPLSMADPRSLPEELDQKTFKAYILEHGFKSEELHWFLDYCCRDDFGAGYDNVSAWAGIHYFAGRKANPANTDPTTVLTWPEGNAYLAHLLAKPVSDQIRPKCLVESVVELPEKVLVTVVDFENKQRLKIEAQNCIFASPSYVAKHVLQSPQWPLDFFEGISHNPWLIGIITLNGLPESNGTPLAWDNVKFGTKGLGYVSNRHQEFKQQLDKHVFSVYLALDRQDAKLERQALFSMSDQEMYQLILHELKSMHPSIEDFIEEMRFQRWGHGMVTPYPGALKKYEHYRQLNGEAKRVLLAHTDYSAYSVFEEAFDCGLKAATKILNV